MDRHDALITGVELRSLGYGVWGQQSAGILGCLGGQPAVVLGVDREYRLAVVTPATGWAVVEVDSVARLGIADYSVLWNVGTGEPLTQATHYEGFSHGREREGFVARRFGVLVAVAGAPHDLFGL